MSKKRHGPRITIPELIAVASAIARIARDVRNLVADAKGDEGKATRAEVLAIVRGALAGEGVDDLVEAIADAVED